MAKKAKSVKKPVKKAVKKAIKNPVIKEVKKPQHVQKKLQKPSAGKSSRTMQKPAPDTNVLNREIDDLVVSLAGEDILPLVALLRGKENISEFTIADRLNITVNQVRNMLYRLHKVNLVTFTRKKDKKKGWYIYYWTLDIGKLEDALFQQKKKQLAEFAEKLAKEEEGKFYVCPEKCKRLTMEDAMEAEFHCPECGQLLVEQDNRRTIDNIKRRIEELSAEIKAEEERQAAEFAKLMAKRKVVRARPVKPAVKKTVKKIVRKKAPARAVKRKIAKKIVKKAVKKIVKKPAKKAAEKKGLKKKVVKNSVKIPVKTGFFSGLRKAVKKVVRKR